MASGKKVIVGLTGPFAGGKGTVIDFFKEKGFFTTSLSDRLREILVSRGEEPTRESLQDLADELRQRQGKDVLARLTWEKIESEGVDRAAIDSIRAVEEADFLKTKSGFVLVGVTAPRRLRFERIKARGREQDPQTWEEFLRLDKKDFTSVGGRNIKACLQKADVKIVNNGSLSDLRLKIDKKLRGLL